MTITFKQNTPFGQNRQKGTTNLLASPKRDSDKFGSPGVTLYTLLWEGGLVLNLSVRKWHKWQNGIKNLSRAPRYLKKAFFRVQTELFRGNFWAGLRHHFRNSMFYNLKFIFYWIFDHWPLHLNKTPLLTKTGKKWPQICWLLPKRDWDKFGSPGVTLYTIVCEGGLVINLSVRKWPKELKIWAGLRGIWKGAFFRSQADISRSYLIYDHTG